MRHGDMCRIFNFKSYVFMLRSRDNLQKITRTKNDPVYRCDVLVVGGGINGAGIAHDLAGRGLSVVLCEKNDWGSATSSASSKLIHGGLRYLEQYEFGLVRSSLIERETLYRLAPHLIKPLRFVLPHDKSLRPKWMIRAGLFLYDHLGGRQRHNVFEKSYMLPLTDHPLHETYKTGFVYTDCWVDDARLVLTNVMAAHEKGAVVLSRTACRGLEADKKAGLWKATLFHKEPGDARGKSHEIKARCVVNAAGPWVESFLPATVKGFKPHYHVRLVKGSHIVVPRLYNGAHAYILQNKDGRIIFVIPYENDYTLIGTTDVAYEGDPAQVKITKEEISYLCDAVGRYFTTPVIPEEVVWSYSGVRPLLDDGTQNASEVTRDYKLDLAHHKSCPLLSVYGGKLTTYRKLSEQVADLLKEEIFPEAGAAWTAEAVLPGADFSPVANLETFLKTLRREYHWLSAEAAEQYVRRYGSNVREIFKNCHHENDMGAYFGAGLYANEIDYMMDFEDAQTAEDILWRRSKCGLHGDPDMFEKLERYIAEKRAGE